MPIQLSAEDLAFLEDIQRLGRDGLSQDQIAARLEMNPSTFRLKVRDLGFQFSRVITLEARPQFGGKPFSEMKSAGEIVVRNAEPATAA